ncbi:MAG TPA: hypothetical protein VMV69_04830 [Pirellulales bacterium]|nr:hypothetical protein [Pirellulales bacterium]
MTNKRKARIDAAVANLDPESRRVMEPWLRAKYGDKTALPAVRELFNERREFRDFCGGDLAKTAIDTLLALRFGEQLASQEAVRHKMAELRAELMGEHPSALERLLVERVVVCWLHAYHADEQTCNMGSITLPWAEYRQRNQDRAHRRYLSAMKTLGTVRRLALPIKLDVNLAATVETKAAKPAGGLPSRLAGAMSSN